jgi:2-polyprenyl-3-methyl-5-hydroxy-6-metoxy-1,4-benzoquinol methylase
MKMPTTESATGRERVRKHFEDNAVEFDDLYEDERLFNRHFRPGLFLRRDFALAVARDYPSGRVLDVGCGSGRFGELALEQGADAYVGVDFSEPRVRMAERRLARFGPRAKLLHGDFLEVSLNGPFEVVLALGFFDYIPEPQRFARRMYELCSGSVAASFPRWNWLKGPFRKVRYEIVNNCPIYHYTERELTFVFGAAGFSRVKVVPRGRTGFLVRADR